MFFSFPEKSSCVHTTFKAKTCRMNSRLRKKHSPFNLIQSRLYGFYDESTTTSNPLPHPHHANFSPFYDTRERRSYDVSTHSQPQPLRLDGAWMELANVILGWIWEVDWKWISGHHKHDFAKPSWDGAPSRHHKKGISILSKFHRLKHAISILLSTCQIRQGPLSQTRTYKLR